MQSVKREKHQDISFEHSPVAEHQSNGVAERAVKTVQGQVRTMKMALEARISEKVVETYDLIPWMVRHAAMLVTLDREETTDELHGNASRDEGSIGMYLSLVRESCI